MLEKKKRFNHDIKFYIFRNIFPWWKSDELSSYEKYEFYPNFFDAGPVNHFVERGLHSSHLTEEASQAWTDEVLKVIKNANN